MHGHRHLITDVLKGELGSTASWSPTGRHRPVDGRAITEAACGPSINAGIDMVMVPYDYRTFISTLREEVNAGRVPLARIDDAVPGS